MILIFCGFLALINPIYGQTLKCSSRGAGVLGGKKVPNVLELIDGQTGYYTTVEVINPDRNNLVHEYYDMQNKLGFVDLEASVQDEMNRRYFYHQTEEKIVIRKNTCTRLDLDETEKIESVKDWFEPQNIVNDSEIFKDFIYLGPTVLMIFAHTIGDRASFIETELIEGRKVNHWFYCSNPNGPYADFYFDVETQLPYRFSLYYPVWIESANPDTNATENIQIDSDKKYVYNFFIFEPLIVSPHDPHPYPLGYGCKHKDAPPHNNLPDFTNVPQFTMDMEAVITYSDEIIRSTARIMKQGDIISYEITEGSDFIRFIELPPPLGRFKVDEHTGKCQFVPTYSYTGVKPLYTSWPLNGLSFNLLNYLVMKPSTEYSKGTTFIGEIDLGPFRVEEYVATKFFASVSDAIIDYYYPASNYSWPESTIPSKVVFTKDLQFDYYWYHAPNKVEVTIIDYRTTNFDYEDRFDVSGCFEDPGTFVWFQLVFSDPWLDTKDYHMSLMRTEIQEILISFIPIIRIAEIHCDLIEGNVYVTVKLNDRVHFIETYDAHPSFSISDPTQIVKQLRVEDCETLCTAHPKCLDFSYCKNFDCLLLVSAIDDYYYWYPDTISDSNCTQYSVPKSFITSPFVKSNYLSTMQQVLHEIRSKVEAGQFHLTYPKLSAEDLFILNGPDEIGDISQDLYRTGLIRPVSGDEFPMIKTEHRFKSGLNTETGIDMNTCFILCANDDDCNSISYCLNQNKECILSNETSITLETSFDDKTVHVDGCNIYEKSYMNMFNQYPGKSLVLDAVSTSSNVLIADCAKECATTTDFNCESFDYCSNSDQRNESVCFLHIHHISTDISHELNTSNWKFAETGCDHFSKKSERDYQHLIGRKLKDTSEEIVLSLYENLSLDQCAYKCTSEAACFTIEFCETIDHTNLFDTSYATSRCRLTGLRPSNKLDEVKLFDVSSTQEDKICSIYVNQLKANKKIDQATKESHKSLESKNHLKLALGLGSFIFVLAFAGGFVGFTFAVKKGLLVYIR